LIVLFSNADGRCDPVPPVDHATANSSSAEAGSVVAYICDAGYRLSDSLPSTTHCNGTRWTELLINCTGSQLHLITLIVIIIISVTLYSSLESSLLLYCTFG